MNTAALWIILTVQALATVIFFAAANPVVAFIATALLIPTAVGLLLRAPWGRTCAIAFSWFALVVSFAVVIPDRDSLSATGVEALLHRSASTVELYAAVVLVTVPWLICIHLLVGHKRFFGRAPS